MQSMGGKITRMPINQATYIDRTIVDVPLDEIPPYGMFQVTFSNRKKQLHGLSRYEAQGTKYASGRVHVDTIYLQVRDFLSLQQMIDFMEEFGDCHISWLRG
jgi:hypothetical protein